MVACALCSGRCESAAVKGDYEYWRCAACGYVFLHPMPTGEELTAWYNRNYRSATASYYPKARSRARRAFLKSLRFFPYVAGKRALDVGCGGGFMAGAFSMMGARAWGLDISEDSIAYARRRFPRTTFCCESMETFAARSLTFDFVFSAELLEHIPSPRPFMALLEAVTRPDAHVYVSAPDAGHPAVPDHFPDWSDLQPPEHVQFFNRANLTRLFADRGFALKRAWTKKSPAHSLLFVRTPDAGQRDRGKGEGPGGRFP